MRIRDWSSDVCSSDLYSQVFAASGGAAPYSYTLTGTLPAGLSFDIASRTLSGVPAEQGSFPISVVATDRSPGPGAPYSISSNYTLQVTAPTIVLAPATLPGGAAGDAYSPALTASGDVSQTPFAVPPGSLPAAPGL